MKVKPLGNRILIKVKETEEKTSGGIILPETAQEKTQVGNVIAIGDDKEAITVKIGDNVVYDKYAGTIISIDDVDHLILAIDDVLAIVE